MLHPLGKARKSPAEVLPSKICSLENDTFQRVDECSIYLCSRASLSWHTNFLHDGETTVAEAFASPTFLEALK